MIVIDAQGYVLGRLGTYVAKKAIQGEEVVLLNAEKIIVTGNKEMIFSKYEGLRNKKSRLNHKGVFFPRRPDMFVRRVLRGMFDRKKTTGIEAYRKLQAHVGVPEEFKNKEMIKPDIKNRSHIYIKEFVTVLDICKYLGYNPKLKSR